MTDTFQKHSRSLTSPPEQAAVVVPADGSDLACVTRALYVGGAGDLRVRMQGGAEVTLAAVPAGALLPLRVRRMLAAGTSATAIVALW